jgi:hypothetical protein
MFIQIVLRIQQKLPGSEQAVNTLLGHCRDQPVTAEWGNTSESQMKTL